jgi:integrase/recombinase XerD
LTVLVRLGLRAGAVAALQLADIDWRAGEVLVHGKGRRAEKLPLPADAGEAVADYLRHGRPRAASRAVFLRLRAPLRGPTPQGVSCVVYHASEQAGLAPIGAHRLRHTAATSFKVSGVASAASFGSSCERRLPA